MLDIYRCLVCLQVSSTNKHYNVKTKIAHKNILMVTYKAYIKPYKASYLKLCKN